MDMVAAGTPGVSWKILYLVWRQPKTDILTIYRLVVETPHLPPHISIFVLSLCNISSSFISSSIVNNLWVSSTPSNVVSEEFLLTHSSSQSYCWDPCISEDFICRKKKLWKFQKENTTSSGTQCVSVLYNPLYCFYAQKWTSVCIKYVFKWVFLYSSVSSIKKGNISFIISNVIL